MSESKSSWILKNLILPNNEIIDKPGYVISKYAGKGTDCYVREVFFPEAVLSALEDRIISLHGEKGRTAIYEAGKLWGIRYGITTGLPKKKDLPKKDFLEFMDTFMKFMESEYAKKARYTLDYSHDHFVSTYDGLMICRINGHGDFLTGTMSGAWQHMAGRPINGCHAKCQGNGDRQCVVDCAPSPLRKARGKKAVREPSMRGLGLEKEYFDFNTIKKAQFARNSFATLLDGRIFRYDDGIFECKGQRFLLNEASSVYFLETRLGALKGGDSILFGAAFDFFKAFGMKNISPNLAHDLLPALGWGDINVSSDATKAICIGYPWTKYAKSTTFPILRGMLSGLVSSFAGKDVLFNRAVCATGSGSLNISLGID
jgi:hypothetical protein